MPDEPEMEAAPELDAVREMEGAPAAEPEPEQESEPEPEADSTRGFRHFRRTSPRYAALWIAFTAWVLFYVAISPFGKQPEIIHLYAALLAVGLLVAGLLMPNLALGFYRWFRNFRRTRPFYAALWVALGGLVLFYLTKSPPKYLPHIGVGGIYGMGAGVALWLIALLILALPSQRYVGGVIAVVLGVVSFPLSNLGGFFVGMFCAVLGGSMAFGWMPKKPAKKRRWFRKIQPAAPSAIGATTAISAGTVIGAAAETGAGI